MHKLTTAETFLIYLLTIGSAISHPTNPELSIQRNFDRQFSSTDQRLRLHKKATADQRTGTLRSASFITRFRMAVVPIVYRGWLDQQRRYSRSNPDVPPAARFVITIFYPSLRQLIPGQGEAARLSPSQRCGCT